MGNQSVLTAEVKTNLGNTGLLSKRFALRGKYSAGCSLTDSTEKRKAIG
ncbi:hypothetical protein [Arsenophonus endosymbiont of Crataerina pallida]